MLLLNEILTHFFIGFGLAVFLVVFCNFRKIHRVPFRFGGDSPFSFGEKQKWMLWYLASCTFEFLTSFHWGVGPRLYIELAFSVVQAFFLTAGFFVVDRISMLFFEPQDHWMPKNTSAQSVVNQANPPPALIVPVDPPPPVESAPIELTPSRKTWLSDKLRNVSADLSERVSGTIEEHRQARDIKREAEEAQRQADAEERRRTFKDLIKDK